MSDKLAVLGMLNSKDMYGYEISKNLRNIEGFWYISRGNLYRALSALEREGLVETKEVVEHNGKMRKIFGITPQGRVEFQNWLDIPAEPPRTRHESFLKIWFSRNDIQKVEMQIDQIRKYSEALVKLFDQMKPIPDDDYLAWVMEVGRNHIELDLKWAEESLRKIDKQKKGKR